MIGASYGMRRPREPPDATAARDAAAVDFGFEAGDTDRRPAASMASLINEGGALMMHAPAHRDDTYDACCWSPWLRANRHTIMPPFLASALRRDF